VRALARRDGTAQRVLLSTAPLDAVTYAHVCATPEQGGALLAFLHAAGGDAGHLRVGVPRWEDRAVVAAPGWTRAASRCRWRPGRSTARGFRPGGAVLFWRPGVRAVGVDDDRPSPRWPTRAIDAGSGALALGAPSAPRVGAGARRSCRCTRAGSRPTSTSRASPRRSRASRSPTSSTTRDVAGVGPGGAAVAGVPATLAIACARGAAHRAGRVGGAERRRGERSRRRARRGRLALAGSRCCGAPRLSADGAPVPRLHATVDPQPRCRCRVAARLPVGHARRVTATLAAPGGALAASVDVGFFAIS
jgi:hypothetical protein